MTETLNTFIADAVSSDFFAGGLALGALGLAAAMLRVLVFTAYGFVMRRIWVSLTLDNRSDAYRNFYLWMEANQVLSRSKHVRMTDNHWSFGTKGFAPAPGSHWFWRNGRLCRLSRNINEKAKVGGSYNSRPMETLHITVLFGRVATILGWINDGKTIAQTRDRIGPGLHVFRTDYWDGLGDVPARRVDTVLVDDDRIERVVEDMRWFYGARDWYAQRGVPWRRGYLFYGPPGTGKSSLIRALASELSLDIATLDVGRTALNDEALREAMMTAPNTSLLAIEDVDAVFTGRDSGDQKTGVSFSGLLNAIDGVAAQEGRALIMTTNHKERLDKALIRPGRADLHVELGHINAATARRLFDRFFPDHADLGRSFEISLGQRQFSPAEVQGWLLENCTDPVTAATGWCQAGDVAPHDISTLLTQPRPSCSSEKMT